MAVSVVRWRFHRPSTGERYTVPVNPNTMTSPFRAHTTTVSPSSPQSGQFRVMRTGAQPPVEWSWGGVGIGYEHYTALATWADYEDRIEVTDHFRRTFTTYFVQFDPTDRKPTPRQDWRFTYTMRTLCLGQVDG